MTEPRKHTLPFSAQRLADRIHGEVADSILIDARSHGTLSLPGDYSPEQHPPPHKTKIVATGDTGYYVDENLIGTPERFHVQYKVWNYRDSPAFAEIILLDPEQAELTYVCPRNRRARAAT